LYATWYAGPILRSDNTPARLSRSTEEKTRTQLIPDTEDMSSIVNGPLLFNAAMSFSSVRIEGLCGSIVAFTATSLGALNSIRAKVAAGSSLK
jgi:hypothetical protein